MVKDRLEDQATEPRSEDVENAAVGLFVVDMKRKLRANSHKKHWGEVSMEYLLDRLYQEADELSVALTPPAFHQGIIDECADVANLAMMIADKARRNVP